MLVQYRGKGRLILIVLCTAALLAAAACDAGQPHGHTVVRESGARITVLDDTSESVYTKLRLEGIDRIDGVRALDWISGEALLVSRENRTLKPETVEGVERYPVNLYTHSLADGTQTPLLEGENDYGAALMSPDHQYMLYRQIDDFIADGHIMNLETGQSVKVSDAPFSSEEGEWADDRHIVFPDMEGNIRRTAVDGSSEIVVKPGVPYVHEVVQSGDTLYYVTGEDMQLSVYNTGSKETAVLKKSVVWVIPSPDGSRLALVERTRPGEMVLTLCDAAGNEQARLASGQQVFGASWSPDGSKLAYSLIPENSGSDPSGVFITEVESGEQTPVLADIGISNQLRWSPSGNALLASSTVMQEGANTFVSYVIRLN
ncbi:PD40 domain-containing protein [Paenibacillus tengchongensis]|uniref:PD40 domain-containing protein n=1 Tax=Paenibacillus tengchongensis TaxID=2608684 RepID=UPI00124D4E5C|nr:PD40 domain-containing protein [Paenibacillus tengchongensis]